MKNALPTLILFSLGLGACGQRTNDGDVPAAVKKAFADKFPEASGTKWEMEHKKDFEANFTDGGGHWSAVFNAQGEWLETEQAMTPEALPGGVRDAIAARYADHRLKEAERSDSPSGTVYEVELVKDGEEKEVVFSPDGTVLKTGMENEEGEQDEQDEKD